MNRESLTPVLVLASRRTVNLEKWGLQFKIDGTLQIAQIASDEGHMQ